ncbi:hypothetical protein ES702_01854 [subsurface metagenome]
MEGSVKYASFFLIFSIVFTYFSYALTFSATPQDRWDITISVEEIMGTGILLGEADDLNLTWGSGYQYFTVNNTEMRVKWGWLAGIGDSIWLETHVTFFGIGLAWTPMGIRDYGNYLHNSSIIIEWNDQIKWSRFHPKNGYELFFTDPEQEHNISRAVYEDGIITVTVAESVDFGDKVHLMTFVSWYAGMVMGTSNYGLPSVFNIVLQLINVLSLLSVVILVKEMISL